MGLETAGLIAGIVGATAAAAGGAHAIKRSTKGMPALPEPPAPPPPAPPAPAPPPPAALDTDAGTAVGAEKKRRSTRYTLADTMIVSPLGGSGSSGRLGA